MANKLDRGSSTSLIHPSKSKSGARKKTNASYNFIANWVVDGQRSASTFQADLKIR